MQKLNRLTQDIVQDLLILNNCTEEVIDFNHTISDELIDYGIKHGVGANLFHRIKIGRIVGIDQTQISTWRSSYLQGSLQFQHKIQTLITIQELLRRYSIPIITLKGMALATSLYQDENVRPMGDIDLLVPEDQGQVALKILLEAGAKQTHTPRSALHEKVHSHVRAVIYNGVLVEIHQRIFSLGNRFYIPTDLCLKNSKLVSTQWGSIHVLNDVLMAYHLICHASYNMKNGGLRFGWLLDIALLFNKQKDIDSYLEQVKIILSEKSHETKEVLKMTFLLLPIEKQVKLIKAEEKESVFHHIFIRMKERDAQKLHKVSNMKEIWNMSLWSLRIKLTWFELFPVKEYMYEWNNQKKEPLLLMHLKRLLHLPK